MLTCGSWRPYGLLGSSERLRLAARTSAEEAGVCGCSLRYLEVLYAFDGLGKAQAKQSVGECRVRRGPWTKRVQRVGRGASMLVGLAVKWPPEGQRNPAGAEVADSMPSSSCCWRWCCCCLGGLGAKNTEKRVPAKRHRLAHPSFSRGERGPHCPAGLARVHLQGTPPGRGQGQPMPALISFSLSHHLRMIATLNRPLRTNKHRTRRVKRLDVVTSRICCSNTPLAISIRCQVSPGRPGGPG